MRCLLNILTCDNNKKTGSECNKQNLPVFFKVRTLFMERQH
jgi:hypothetical protein